MVRSGSRKDLKKKDSVQKTKEDSPLREIDDGVIDDNSKKFESHMDNDLDRLSGISQDAEAPSEFIDYSESICSILDNKDQEDEYKNDDDPGFDLYEVGEPEFDNVCNHLGMEFDFPNRAVKLGVKKRKNGMAKKIEPSEEEKKIGREKGYIYLPDTVTHPTHEDSFYPVGHHNTIYDCFNLKVIYDRERTGFEETKEFPIIIGSIVAGRYIIKEYLGSAAFSKAIQCQDLRTGNHYCMKIIENNKDYFD